MADTGQITVPVRPRNMDRGSSAYGDPTSCAIDIDSVPMPEQCSYLVRGKRRCKRTAVQAAGFEETLCSVHQPQALAQSHALSILSVKLAEAKLGDGPCAPAAATEAAVRAPGSKPRVSSSQNRMRNPLSVPPPETDRCTAFMEQYPNPDLPVLVDAGCAQGKFLRALASARDQWWAGTPGCNLLGVELRGWCVDSAMATVPPCHSPPLQYFEGNINSALLPLLCCPRTSASPGDVTGPGADDAPTIPTIPMAPAPALPHSVDTAVSAAVARPRQLRGVLIQFPDPWAKAKTRRRRILQPELAAAIVDNLEDGVGFVYISTDCADLAVEMAGVLDGFGQLDRSSDGLDPNGGPSRWLRGNPFGVLSEREEVCGELGRRVFRALYTKRQRGGTTDNPAPQSQ